MKVNKDLYNLASHVLGLVDLGFLIACVHKSYYVLHSGFFAVIMLVMLLLLDTFISLNVCNITLRDMMVEGQNIIQKHAKRSQELYASNIFPLTCSCKMIVMILFKLLQG